MLIANIGYQQRSADEICETLRTEQIVVLLDVRERAWSHRPEFRKTALRNRLALANIGYEHIKEAGNPHRPRANTKRNTLACAAAYKNHLLANIDIIDALVTRLKRQRSALFCYERQRRDCHRNILIEQILSRHPNVHILDL